jgi:phosphatidylglycerol lysyltransferase
MEQIPTVWTAQHALPPMGFMVTLELFQHAELRRYFVTEHADRVVGFAVCVPIPGKNGWLVEDMMFVEGAPAGASEQLIDTVMRALANEGAALVSLGMVALAGLENPSEARHPWLTAFLRFSGRTMGALYNFEGLYRFRNKLRPMDWEPVYIVTYGAVTPMTFRAVLMAFAQGWLPRFALRVLGRWARQWVHR